MSDLPAQKPVCVVVGVGPGNGSAFARRFAAEGYAVALLARSTGLTSGWRGSFRWRAPMLAMWATSQRWSGPLH